MKETAVARSIGAAPQDCATRAYPRVRQPRATPRTFATHRGTEQGFHLTPRELEVLALLSEGLPNKLICRRLNIAAGTVKVHIGCIFQELGVRSRLEAVVTARRLGIA